PEELEAKRAEALIQREKKELEAVKLELLALENQEALLSTSNSWVKPCLVGGVVLGVGYILGRHLAKKKQAEQEKPHAVKEATADTKSTEEVANPQENEQEQAQ
nr:hypothetical protein [Candidatus Dependentiae bacterium]